MQKLQEGKFSSFLSLRRDKGNDALCSGLIVVKRIICNFFVLIINERTLKVYICNLK